MFNDKISLPFFMYAKSCALGRGTMAAFDRVCSGILYNAIFENDKTIRFDTSILADFKNIFDDRVSANQTVKDIVAVYDVSEDNICIYHDMKKERILCARV